LTAGATMTIRITAIWITIVVGLPITIDYHCCETMTPGHAGCLPPRKNSRHELAIRRYSLIPEILRNSRS
jgi:hypothetical protein